MSEASSGPRSPIAKILSTMTPGELAALSTVEVAPARIPVEFVSPEEFAAIDAVASALAAGLDVPGIARAVLAAVDPIITDREHDNYQEQRGLDNS